jgi:hypothetical protein
MPQNNKRQERGNVFLFILLGIVLFAGLSFVISRGFQSEGTQKISDRRAELAASDIMAYVQKLERGINKIRNKSISENSISVEHNGAFVNTACDAAPDASFPGCQLFNSAGGAITPQDPGKDAHDGSDWFFTGSTCIGGLGTGTTGCDSDGSSNEELLVILPNVNASVCTELNKKLNITGIPADTGGSYSTTPFTGGFADGTEIILAGGAYSAACFSNTGSNHFYYTLLAR